MRKHAAGRSIPSVKKGNVVLTKLVELYPRWAFQSLTMIEVRVDSFFPVSCLFLGFVVVCGGGVGVRGRRGGRARPPRKLRLVYL